MEYLTMQIDDFKLHLKNRIPFEPDDVLKVLGQRLKSGKSVYNDVLSLQARLSTLKRDAAMNRLKDYDEESRHYSRVWDALIMLVDSLLPDDLQEKGEFKILGICRNETDKAYLTQYFSALPVKADVIETTRYVAPTDYSLIVFDAHAIGVLRGEDDYEKLTEDKKTFLLLLQKYLEKSPVWLIYYGEMNYLLNGFRETSNAANNKFTLYARINEMHQFINDFQIGRNVE